MAASLTIRSPQIFFDLQIRRPLISFWANNRYKSYGPVRYVAGKYKRSKECPFAQHLENRKEKGTKIFQDGNTKNVQVASWGSNMDNNCFKKRHFGDLGSSYLEQSENFSEFDDSRDSSLENYEVNVKDEPILPCDEGRATGLSEVTEMGKPMNNILKQDAEHMAIELLSARAFTALELQKKLQRKGFPPDVINSVIANIKERGLLNDGLYAELFSRSRWQTLTWGPKRIKQALIKKGVSAIEADEATKQVFEENNSQCDSQNIQHGMSKAALERLYLQAAKQWLRGRSTSLENRKSRIIRWLQYRGFSWGITSLILKRLEADHT